MACFCSVCYIDRLYGAVYCELAEQANNLLKYQTLMQHNHISSHSRALLRDMECFPVRKDRRGKVSWDFDDGYGAPRTFGGKRSHEGVDIMASKDQPGCLQIQSVCDGVIEQIGWLKLGGYRIGIQFQTGILCVLCAFTAICT